MDELLDAYYDARGWDRNGIPTSETLERVGLESILNRASRLNPFFDTISEELKADDIDVSADLYVYTPNDKPVIGPCDEIKSLHLNCGYWCGVMMAPQAGKRVADIVTGKMDNKDNPLRYSRFKEGNFEKGDTFLK